MSDFIINKKCFTHTAPEIRLQPRRLGKYLSITKFPFKMKLTLPEIF